MASGWGTIDAARFVPSLVSATRGSGLTDAARLTALAQLTALERDSIRLSAASIPHGGTASLTAGDFLPGHPVTLSIDGTLITTLQADAQGSVADTIDPALLNLTPGRHTISLGSMLLTETAEFRSS